MPFSWLSGQGPSGVSREDGPSGAREYGSIREEGPHSQKRALEEQDEDVDLLDEAEALELVEFDPKVNPKDTSPPPK